MIKMEYIYGETLFLAVLLERARTEPLGLGPIGFGSWIPASRYTLVDQKRSTFALIYA